MESRVVWYNDPRHLHVLKLSNHWHCPGLSWCSILYIAHVAWQNINQLQWNREVCEKIARQSGSKPRWSAKSLSDLYWHAQDTAKVILKSGKSESISIIISAVRALIANDGVQYGHRVQEGPYPFHCLARWEKEALIGTYLVKLHTDLKTHTNTLWSAGSNIQYWSVTDRCFIISSDRDRGNCLLLSGLFPTEQDLRHVHSAHWELLTPSQRYVIKARRKNTGKNKDLDIENEATL